MRRLVVLFGVVLMVVGALAGAGSATAKPAVPVVRSQTATAGPLSARPFTLVGANLASVGKVRFGGATAGRLAHKGSRVLTMIAPGSRQPGAVSISVLSSGKWRAVARYTYVARPVVTKLAASSGVVSGGYLITVAGRDLGGASSARLGATVLAIKARTPNSLRVVVPAGVLGKSHVTVTTPGGTSAYSANTIFTYTTPTAADAVTYRAASDTLTATGVQWVSRPDASGTDVDSDNYAPWIVSVESGGALPEVGDGYLLPAGSVAYPSGFAGTVASLAAQQDGSTRVTVDPTPLTDTLSSYAIRYAPSVPNGAGARRAASSGNDRFDFAGLKANVFSCTHGDDGEYATFTGEIGLRFADVRPVVNLTGGLQPGLDAYVTGNVTAYGKLSVDASMTCTLKKAWVNANKKIVPVGTTGATVSFAPAATVTISGSATVSIEQTTRFTYGLAASVSGSPRFYQAVSQDAAKSSATASAKIQASFGVAVQIAWLDRVGINIDARLYADGSLAYTSSPRRVCADIAFGFRLAVKGFLDLLVRQWETEKFEKTFPFAKLAKCTTPDTAALADGNPAITSSTLPDATAGDGYDYELETADNRNGAWSVVGGTMPPGLTLDGSELTGSPTGVGSYRPQVRFQDSLGRETSATLSLRVLPSQGLGGGDIQATLTWNSEADLDLHAQEPSGDEIYYQNPGPTDSGGELDHDANAACRTADAEPAENVYWPSESADAGSYYFHVRTYDDCGTSDLNWHLVVRVQGRVVIDVTGYDTSDYYELDYGSDQRVARVKTTSVAPAGMRHRTAEPKR